MIYPLVKECERDGIPITVTCRVLGFSRAGFYKWKNRPVSPRDQTDARTINAILKVHKKDPAFGYRLIADELRTEGFQVSENRVHRLCKQEGITSIIKRGKKQKRTPLPVHDDLVNRNFTATRRDVIWLTDITEHGTKEGKLYLCAVKDVFSGRIVGWSLASHMRGSLAVNALRNAITARRPCKTIIHSDRGTQFSSKAYLRLVKNHDLQGSMGRVGACGDNAAMESFFSLLQNNVLDAKRWESREELTKAIVCWIESTYNRRRRQRRLGKLTPVEFEVIHQTGKAA